MSDTPPIPLALTADEWRPKLCAEAYCGSECRNGIPAICVDGMDLQRWDGGVVTIHNEYQIERPHALAALCLHGQSFGFTRQEADELRACTVALRQCSDFGETGLNLADAAALDRIAAKVRALLPPSPEETP